MGSVVEGATCCAVLIVAEGGVIATVKTGTGSAAAALEAVGAKSGSNTGTREGVCRS